MKKINVLALFILLFSSSIFSQKYVYSCSGKDGTSFYIYSDIVKTNAIGIYQVWVKASYSDKSKEHVIEHIKKYKNDGVTDEQITSLFFSMKLCLFDIRQNRYKSLSVSYENTNGDILKSYSNSESEINWEYIEPESVFEGVLITIKSLLNNKP